MKAQKIYEDLIQKSFEITDFDITGNKTRRTEVILIKGCIINVLSKYFGFNTILIGSLTDLHYSTVIHHLRKHVDRFKLEDDYADLYTTLSKHVMTHSTAPIDVNGIINTLRSCLNVN